MRESLVVTLIGADRPGIVARLAALAAEHGAGWDESRLVRLAGRFAGVVRLDVPTEAVAALEQALAALASEGLRLTIERGDAAPAGGPEPALLELVGHDRQGIVRDISAALARHGVSIEELDTELQSASMTGELMFHARASLRLPDGANVEALRADLEAIADELMVDLRVDTRSRSRS
jgi:glycine cleavage system regulatory protein